MKKGFTLIEVIIYIALFSLLMGSAFVVVYQLIEGSDKLSVKNTTQEEGNFVMRKFNWALTGISSIDSPSSGTSNILKVTKYGGNKINICLDSNKIKIREGGTTCSGNSTELLPLTTDNVVVSDLSFEFIPAVGSGPSGIKATVKIDEIDFTITKYLRK